ncbi:hypothetical protein C1890_29645 [Pseudomonas sp. DP16D-R1]|nr:hypothetical protein C1890_29645 [Pseudomonas sp. DP16D-R1]
MVICSGLFPVVRQLAQVLFFVLENRLSPFRPAQLLLLLEYTTSAEALSCPRKFGFLTLRWELLFVR